MGFLHQAYVIKDAFISDVGLLASPTENAVPLRETIKAVNNQSTNIIYSTDHSLLKLTWQDFPEVYFLHYFLG